MLSVILSIKVVFSSPFFLINYRVTFPTWNRLLPLEECVSGHCVGECDRVPVKLLS